VRGEQESESDLDILVEFEKDPSFFDYIRLEDYLSDILGVKVDLVMKSALEPAIGKHIFDEVVAVCRKKDSLEIIYPIHYASVPRRTSRFILVLRQRLRRFSGNKIRTYALKARNQVQ
jgi:hypothetical protein